MTARSAVTIVGNGGYCETGIRHQTRPMITKRPASERGHANHGWLQTHYTFSFADYIDPAWNGFGPLRVINQDVIAPGRGFGTHGHQDMEIVTYVLSGALEHRDSMGNGSIIGPGEVQVMSAGTGVRHSELSVSTSEATELLQMWILPESAGTKPRYEQRAFPSDERRGRLQLIVSPTGEHRSLRIGQDVRLFSALLGAGDIVTHTLEPGRRAWLHVASGKISFDGEIYDSGDGAAIENTHDFKLEGVEATDLVLFDLPGESR